VRAVEVPADRVARIALDRAWHTRALIGGVVTLGAFVLFGALTCARTDTSLVILGRSIWLVGLGLATCLLRRRARRAARVAQLATSGQGYRFALVDYRIGGGTVLITKGPSAFHDELTLAVSAKTVAALHAMPTAKVVS